MPLAHRNESKEFVVRRITQGATVVAAWHPAIGPVFWRFTDESSVNAPDHYGVGAGIDRAHRFRRGQINYARFSREIYDCNTRLVLVGHEEEFGPYEDTVPSGDFETLAARSGVGLNELLGWFDNAIWVECPAPPTVAFLSDFNGFVGYSPVWSDDINEAIRFSQSELDSDDLDADLARRLGQVVELEVAAEPLGFMPAAQSNVVNHPLEADIAWTHHRLRLGDYLAMSKWERTAFQNAARAGRDYVLSGDTGEIPGHLAPFPELVLAFQAGAAVQRCWLGHACARETTISIAA